MFCNSCGKEMPDNSKFCNNCGASNIAVAQPAAASGAYAAPVQKNNTQKIAALLAVLLVVTMMFSWFSVSLPVAGVAEVPGLSGTAVSMSIFDLSHIAIFTTKLMNAAETAMRTEYDDYYGYESYSSSVRNSEMTAFQQVKGGVTTAVAFIFSIAGVSILAILALVAFIFMMLNGSKGSAIMGQIAYALALVSAIVFIVAISIANSNLSNAFRGGGIYNMSMQLTPSLWFYGAVVLGLAGGAFVTAKKKVIRGF